MGSFFPVPTVIAVGTTVIICNHLFLLMTQYLKTPLDMTFIKRIYNLSQKVLEVLNRAKGHNIKIMFKPFQERRVDKCGYIKLN